MLEQPIWQRSVCDFCGRNYSIPDYCECLDNLRGHARSCAVETCSQGYWNGFEIGYDDPSEIVLNDSPSIEDCEDLIRSFGAQTKESMEFWKNEWRIAIVSWLYQLLDYQKVCSVCGQEILSTDGNFLTTDDSCSRCSLLTAPPF